MISTRTMQMRLLRTRTKSNEVAKHKNNDSAKHKNNGNVLAKNMNIANVDAKEENDDK